LNNNDYIDVLIGLALSGEASPVQLAELEQWKSASPGNMEYFRQMNRLFHEIPAANVQLTFNTDKAWEKLQKEIQARKSDPVIRNIDRTKGRYDLLRIAAMLFIVAGIGFAVYKILTPGATPAVIVESNQGIKEIKMPDSSNVVMNRNTTVAYTFNKHKRVVELHGEAFFEIASDPSRPFEVHATGIIIRDIGTSFNVRAIEGNDSLLVQVTEGEVNMTSGKSQVLVLKKGEEGLYLKSRDEFIKLALNDTNAIAYKTKIFVFENASLQSVVQKLNEVYGIQIILSPAINDCHLTATFKNENPDAIIDIIVETLQLKLTKEHNRILLDGAVCE